MAEGVSHFAGGGCHQVAQSAPGACFRKRWHMADSGHVAKIRLVLPTLRVEPHYVALVIRPGLARKDGMPRRHLKNHGSGLSQSEAKSDYLRFGTSPPHYSALGGRCFPGADEVARSEGHL